MRKGKQTLSTWILLLLALVVFSNSSGQTTSSYPYFNEWYRFDQNYIKLLLAEDGMYRVSLADLQNAGVDVAGIVPENIQVFYRGKEQKIRVAKNGGSLAHFDFWGRENDGHLDSLIYRSPLSPFGYDPEQQPNVHSSFFSDTSAYFITWDSVGTQQTEELNLQNYSSYNPEPWYRYRSLQEYEQTYLIGGGSDNNPNHVLNPDYITGEGLVGPNVQAGGNIDAAAKFLPTPGFANSGASSKLVARFMNYTTASEHILEIEANLQNVVRDTTVGINIATRETNLNFSLPNQTLIRYTAHGQGSRPDKGYPCWHYIEYDRNFDMDSSAMTIVRNWSRLDTTYFRFYNADVNAEAFLFDPAGNRSIRGTVVGDTLHFLVPGFPGSRTLYIYTDRALKSPQIESRTSLANLSNPATEAEFVIISHKAFENSAEKYATYRDTNSVNPLRSKVVYIDEIYEEFGYGSMTPWAIKNFCKYAMDNWALPPRFFMLWGKGRAAPRVDNVVNFVPVFGEPANDYEYVSNFDRNSPNLAPLAAIGRVSIYTDQEGLDYLTKVDAYEHAPYEAWQKEAVFLGGGKTLTEQDRIRSSLEALFMPYLEDQPMGGKVHYFQKKNTGNISNSDLTAEEHINRGVGLIHFFGHSSTNIFDVDILEAKLYQNYGKLPFMVAFGCHGGDFNNAAQSFGERFILEPNRGSIGYLANTTAGFLEQLRFFGEDFYQNLMQNHYGEPIGVVMQSTIEQFATSGNFQSNIYTTNHAKQMNLQGDPSVVLGFPQKPDLRIADEDLFFEPENLSALDNFYTMNLIVHNDGRTFSDSFNLRIQHRAPNGANIVYPEQSYAPIDFVDTIQYTIVNNLGTELSGLNRYELFVDAQDSLDEYYEPNNLLLREEIIQGNIPAIIYPYEFAIIDSNRVSLTASTWLIGRQESMNFAFEIDTTHTFTSAARIGSGSVTGSPANGKWEVPFDLVPGQVYYWRVRLADIYPVQWNESSFKYEPGKTGWAQVDEPQFLRDPSSQILMDETNMLWRFDQKTYNLHCFIQSFGEFNGRPELFYGPYVSQNSPDNGLCYVAIDDKTLETSFQDLFHGDWNFVAAHDPADPLGDFLQFHLLTLHDHINQTPEGHYYLICSAKNPRLQFWEQEWFLPFAQIGVDPVQMEGFEDGDRLIIFGRKGDPPGSAIVIREPNLPLGSSPPRHDLLIDLTSNFDSATVTSTQIGPTDDWSQFFKDWSSLDHSVQEDVRTAVYGVRPDNSEQLLLDDLTTGIHSLSTVDETEFPFMRLRATPIDDRFYTAPQLDQWEVYYAPAPDAAVDPSVAFDIPDTLQEGQIVKVKLGVRNVTEFDMDSLLVRLSIQRSNRSTNVVAEDRFAPLRALETGEVELAFHSAGKDLEGNVTVIVEINPDLDQIEQHQFNNYYFHRAFVETDHISPILDVTIDGKRIMDGDIVSPEPEILIEINDENEYLPVTVSDTTYKVWFGQERTFQLNPQIFIEGNTQIEQRTGRLPDNKSQLVFRPGRLVDGEYTLAVQGYDFKGNASGDSEFVIHFNVVNEKAISKVLPYPNPFSSSAKFVYTLTGDEKPYVFEIHIYTISGRLVKVIDLLALEDVDFGYNITDYAWDGTDEFGDPLANGVYIYKAKVKFRDRFGVSERDEGIDQYFNKSGFGKIYLMR